METKIIISGSGGQGIMFVGKLIAEAALEEGKNVTYLPAYGAEVRGGTANCTVVISDEEIGSPFAESCDILVAMNEPSLERFRPQVRAGGVIIANSSLIPDAGKALAFPFTQTAIGLGAARAANMVAAGCFAKKTGIVSVASVLSVLSKKGAKAAVAAINTKAVEAGAAF